MIEMDSASDSRVGRRPWLVGRRRSLLSNLRANVRTPSLTTFGQLLVVILAGGMGRKEQEYFPETV